MIEINPYELAKSNLLNDTFTLTSEYLTKSELYYQDNFEWFAIVDDDYDGYEPNLWLAIVCLTEDRIIQDSLHISVFEVAKPIRSLGFGSKIINMLIEKAISLGYKFATLQIREPKLESFYNRFGFNKTSLSNIEFMLINLTNF